MNITLTSSGEQSHRLKTSGASAGASITHGKLAILELLPVKPLVGAENIVDVQSLAKGLGGSWHGKLQQQKPVF